MSRDHLAALRARCRAAQGLAEACHALLAAPGADAGRRGSAPPDAAPLHIGVKARRPRDLRGCSGSLPS
ncbi:MAG: hypothetical protein IH998_15585 [Proteobacteria bacterium]|nr:hypothetical protein [Pseudomonadota bacterium]